MHNGARVKGSFRDADAAFSGKDRAFVDRLQPESERVEAVRTEGIGILLSGLDDAAREIPDGQGGTLANEPAFRGKALSLKVRFEAVKALEQRVPGGVETGPGDDVAADILEILRTKLHRDVCTLAVEALGYYALPMPGERPGDNEAPLGGAYARSLRQGMLARLFDSQGSLDALRDRLARQLLGARNSGEPRTGH